MKNITLEKLNTFAVYLESKISSIFVQKENGKRLSSNDYTDMEKEKLSGIDAGANLTVTDSELSGISENPIQNKAVKAGLDGLHTALSAHSAAQERHIADDERIGWNEASKKMGYLDISYDSAANTVSIGRVSQEE